MQKQQNYEDDFQLQQPQKKTQSKKQKQQNVSNIPSWLAQIPKNMPPHKKSPQLLKAIKTLSSDNSSMTGIQKDIYKLYKKFPSTFWQQLSKRNTPEGQTQHEKILRKLGEIHQFPIIATKLNIPITKKPPQYSYLGKNVYK